MNKGSRNKHTIRLLKWIRSHSGWWQLICTPGDERMTLDMMQLLIQKLAQKSLYELIFVLLTVHRKEPFMQGLAEYELLDRLIADWDSDHDAIIQGLIQHFE